MKAADEKLTGKLRKISQSPGVYLMKNAAGDIIYVGKAKNLKKRVSQYFSGKNAGIKTEHLVSKIHDIETIVSNSELDAFLLENTLIKQYKPKYNISLKDDKSYPYIKIVATKTGFPYIIKTRSFKKDGGEYFGPYSNAFAVTQAVKTAVNIFKIRTCSEGKFNLYSLKKKPCLYFQIKMCSAPCCGYVDKETYGKSIESARLLLKGRNKQLLKELKIKMAERVKELNFEAAISLRDKINAIIAVKEKQAVVMKDERNVDAVGFYCSGGNASFVILAIRGGRVTGTRNFFVKNAYIECSEMPASFMNRYYSRAVEFASDVPEEIAVPSGMINDEDRAALMEYISRFSGKNTRIVETGRGARSGGGGRYETVLSMAFENAKKNYSENLGPKDYEIPENFGAMDKAVNPNGSIADNLGGINSEAGEESSSERFNVKANPFKVGTDGTYGSKPLLVLQKALGLSRFPAIIECFDISNISGTYAVGSKAVFRNGEKDASLYRRYRIRSKDTPDDYAMMYEVLSRRFANAASGKDPLPDIIMVDGGKGQLNVLLAAAKEFASRNGNYGGVKDDASAVQEMPALIAIAKDKDAKKFTGKYKAGNPAGGIDRIYVAGRKNELNIGGSKDTIFLLMRLRDEAHRFAVSYFSSIKGKSVTTSELMNVKGVGKKVYSMLMENFGSVENIKKLDVNELSAAKGINKKTAENIYDYFNGGNRK